MVRLGAHSCRIQKAWGLTDLARDQGRDRLRQPRWQHIAALSTWVLDSEVPSWLWSSEPVSSFKCSIQVLSLQMICAGQCQCRLQSRRLGSQSVVVNTVRIRLQVYFKVDRAENRGKAGCWSRIVMSFQSVPMMFASRIWRPVFRVRVRARVR